MILHPDHGAAVLRDSLLYNVHAAHYLESGNHRIPEVFRNGKYLMKSAVDSHPDDHLVLRRLQVNIGCLLVDGALDDGVDQADGRCVLFLFFLIRRRLDFIRRKSGLGTHLCHGFCRALITVKHADGMIYGSLRRNHGNDFLLRSIVRFLQRHEVQRIGHRQKQGVPRYSDRNDGVLACQCLRHVLRHRGIDLGLCQIDKINAELNTKGINQLRFRDISVINQLTAEPLPVFLLFFQRVTQLVFSDVTLLNEHISQSFIFHISCLSIYRSMLYCLPVCSPWNGW